MMSKQFQVDWDNVNDVLNRALMNMIKAIDVKEDEKWEDE